MVDADPGTGEGHTGGAGAGRTSRSGDLGGYIREQRKRAQLSLRNLAKLAGVSNPYLSQIERGLRKPSAEILQAIARALRISAETLYVKAGILEEAGDRHDVESALARDPYLTEPQRQALLEMYRSFVRLSELQAGSQSPRGRRQGSLRGLLGGGREAAADVAGAAADAVEAAARTVAGGEDTGEEEPGRRPGEDDHAGGQRERETRGERDEREARGE